MRFTGEQLTEWRVTVLIINRVSHCLMPQIFEIPIQNDLFYCVWSRTLDSCSLTTTLNDSHQLVSKTAMSLQGSTTVVGNT